MTGIIKSALAAALLSPGLVLAASPPVRPTPPPPDSTIVARPPAAVAPAPATQPSYSGARLDAKIDAAVNKGVAFLVKSQNANGSWGTGGHTRGYEIYSMVPGSQDAYRVGTTALCVMALRETCENPQTDKLTRAAHSRGLDYLIHHGQARRDDGKLLYNTWAHIYALQALSMELRQASGTPLEGQIRKAAEWQLDRLGRYETYIGGWNYYDFNDQTEKPSGGPTSFGTAAGLVALWEAKQAGLNVPQRMLDLALKRLEEMRLPNGAYLYGTEYKYIPRLPADQPRGSVGRTQAGNFALWLWGKGGINQIKARESLNFFFREHDYIAMGQKRQYPHESWYQTAPYYYYFGHYYAGRLVEKLNPTGRSAYGRKLAEMGILPFQDPDGSWWDFAMWDYHKPYGTAFAVMTLLRCR